MTHEDLHDLVPVHLSSLMVPPLYFVVCTAATPSPLCPTITEVRLQALQHAIPLQGKLQVPPYLPCPKLHLRHSVVYLIPKRSVVLGKVLRLQD